MSKVEYKLSKIGEYRSPIEVINALVHHLIKRCIHTDLRVLEVVDLEQVTEVSVRRPPARARPDSNLSLSAPR